MAHIEKQPLWSVSLFRVKKKSKRFFLFSLDPPNQRSKSNRKMFLMRMVLGESFLCTARDPHKYRRPPCANTKHLRDDCLETSHGSFDSVIGQAKRLLFREFVVYESDQCYPEYLISYDRV